MIGTFSAAFVYNLLFNFPHSKKAQLAGLCFPGSLQPFEDISNNLSSQSSSEFVYEANSCLYFSSELLKKCHHIVHLTSGASSLESTV